MSKIVFIDSIVNWEYVNKLLKHNQKIKGIFSIRNNSVILSDNYYLPRYFTHATMCAKKFLTLLKYWKIVDAWLILVYCLQHYNGV